MLDGLKENSVAVMRSSFSCWAEAGRDTAIAQSNTKQLLPFFSSIALFFVGIDKGFTNVADNRPDLSIVQHMAISQHRVESGLLNGANLPVLDEIKEKIITEARHQLRVGEIHGRGLSFANEVFRRRLLSKCPFTIATAALTVTNRTRVLEDLFHLRRLAPALAERPLIFDQLAYLFVIEHCPKGGHGKGFEFFVRDLPF